MPHIYRNAWAELILFITLILLTTGRPVYAAPELAIGDYQLVSSKRISRTEYEYTYSASITNTSRDAQDVVAYLELNIGGVTILDDKLEFGDVPSGDSAKSLDTFTIRHNRLHILNLNDINWKIHYIAARRITKINDTGITTCTDGERDNLPCPVRGLPGQDAEYGRDALATAGSLQKVGGGSAGFDFTKLDDNGNPLPTDAIVWSCVKDNHTGLIWEEKNRSGLRSGYNTYTWYNPDSSTNGGDPGVQNGGNCTGSSCDTHGYVQAVNAQGLCGGNNWRMPIREELRSIVDYSRLFPTIDTDYFSQESLHDRYWSASQLASPLVVNGVVFHAWHVNFRFGFEDEFPSFDDPTYHIRLVRGGE